MKRYKMSGHHGGPHGRSIESDVVESSDGEWVKWEDFEKYTATKIAQAIFEIIFEITRFETEKRQYGS